MPYCQNCGIKIKDADDFCPSCGKKTKLEKVVERVIEKVPKVVQVEKRTEGAKKKEYTDAEIFKLKINYWTTYGVAGFWFGLGLILFLKWSKLWGFLCILVGILCLIYAQYEKLKYKRKAGLIVFKEKT